MTEAILLIVVLCLIGGVYYDQMRNRKEIERLTDAFMDNNLITRAHGELLGNIARYLEEMADGK